MQIIYSGVQSHYIARSRAGRHFYGTVNEIWAGFGPVGNTYWKTHFGPIMSNFWGLFFMFSRPKKRFIFFKNIYCSVRTKKLHNSSFIIFWFFLPQNRLNIHNQIYWRHLPARLLYNDFGPEYTSIFII